MPIVKVNLVLDNATYAGVKAGTLELCGLAKEVGSKKIRKHLPTVLDSAKEGAAQAVAFVRGNLKVLLIFVGIAALFGGIYGIYKYFSEKDKRKAKKHFGISLQKYLDSAQKGKLTIGIVDALLKDLDVLSKYYKDKSIPLNISAKQLGVLFNSIYEYTIEMANANNVTIPKIPTPKRFSKSTMIDFEKYLNAQKQILHDAA